MGADDQEVRLRWGFQQCRSGRLLDQMSADWGIMALRARHTRSVVEHLRW
ncbi:hypothetical protein M878_00300 [Streptomyces roseochromogenus subsp. oscitans DS 12.976]|uniref:Uncharacterized protein n=1 Tax=Streptomyces roseochromogenus subsp. oscitans DS 12.976 TaxID=1352936 RepID=V6L6I2_STRRC|nr:hypothetical protein M878_00300 [Streptomyces roseochromogenus subsp. oscitans DS 12.976]